MRTRFTTIAATTLLLVGACGSGQVQVGGQVTTPSEPTTTTSPGSSPVTTAPTGIATQDMLPVTVYFLADDGESKTRPGPFLIPVERQMPIETDTLTGPVPSLTGAIKALLAGPTDAESANTPAISSSVPNTSTLLGVTVSGMTFDETGAAIGVGTAEINLSSGFESGGGTFSISSRLAQLVYTATAFNGIDAVRLLIDGQPADVFSSEGLVIDAPMTRDDFIDLVPGILVESPASGAVVSGPVWLRGTAAVFEAVFQVRLEADGVVLWEGIVETTNGMGWGAFDTGIGYDVAVETPATLTVWEYSAEDGSAINERTHHLLLEPWTRVTENGCPTIPGLVAVGPGDLRFGVVQQAQDLTGGIELTIDPARFLTGELAQVAATVDGQEAPGGFYIQMVGSSSRPQVVASDAIVCLITTEGTGGFLEDRGYPGLERITPAEYAAVYNDSGSPKWYSGGRWVWYTHDGDVITSIVEQYLP